MLDRGVEPRGILLGRGEVEGAEQALGLRERGVETNGLACLLLGLRDDVQVAKKLGVLEAHDRVVRHLLEHLPVERRALPGSAPPRRPCARRGRPFGWRRGSSPAGGGRRGSGDAPAATALTRRGAAEAASQGAAQHRGERRSRPENSVLHSRNVARGFAARARPRRYAPRIAPLRCFAPCPRWRSNVFLLSGRRARCPRAPARAETGNVSRGSLASAAPQSGTTAPQRSPCTKRVDVKYGIPRTSRGVLIVVAEDLDRARLVKADHPAGEPVTQRVLKLNHVRSIPTGVYTYQQMLSVFGAAGRCWIPVKLTMTSHEWCGNSFAEWTARPSSARDPLLLRDARRRRRRALRRRRRLLRRAPPGSCALSTSSARAPDDPGHRERLLFEAPAPEDRGRRARDHAALGRRGPTAWRSGGTADRHLDFERDFPIGSSSGNGATAGSMRLKRANAFATGRRTLPATSGSCGPPLRDNRRDDAPTRNDPSPLRRRQRGERHPRPRRPGLRRRTARNPAHRAGLRLRGRHRQGALGAARLPVHPLERSRRGVRNRDTAALPAKFAIRHSAVPVELGEGFIRIALRDPANLRILDELFFVTGKKILPGGRARGPSLPGPREVLRRAPHAAFRHPRGKALAADRALGHQEAASAAA